MKCRCSTNVKYIESVLGAKEMEVCDCMLGVGDILEVLAMRKKLCRIWYRWEERLGGE